MEGVLLLALLVLTFAAGRIGERRHLRDLARREERVQGLRGAPRLRITTCESTGARDAWDSAAGPVDAALVMGSVVVSVDYFHRAIEAIRALFGGRLRAYERALARARREAVLRMQEAAAGEGYREVVAVRLLTAHLASARRGGEGTAGLEVVAVGTGLRSRR